jgi:hypothetical protein
MGVIKRAINAGLARVNLRAELHRRPGVFGLELRRTGLPGPAPELAPIFEDPYEAMCYVQGERSASFRCPIDQCVTVNGLNYSKNGWHPFVAAVTEYLEKTVTSYEGSVLQRYYDKWRPASAAEALIDPDSAPAAFRELHPCLMYLFPWNALTQEQILQGIRQWSLKDYREYGLDDYDFDKSGFKHHGPVDSRLGEIEWQRLVRVAESVQRQGFRRELGQIRVILIKRGHDARFMVNGGGLHRTAAMRALGETSVPATFMHPWIVDVKDVEKWPRVRQGMWPVEQAKRYIDHLFDFDARSWARELGMLPSPN